MVELRPLVLGLGAAFHKGARLLERRPLDAACLDSAALPGGASGAAVTCGELARFYASRRLGPLDVAEIVNKAARLAPARGVSFLNGAIYELCERDPTRPRQRDGKQVEARLYPLPPEKKSRKAFLSGRRWAARRAQ